MNGINNHVNSRINSINNNNCDQQSMTRSTTGVPQLHQHSQNNEGNAAILRNFSMAPGQRCVSLNQDFHRDNNDINSSHEGSSSPEETSSESSEWESGE